MLIAYNNQQQLFLPYQYTRKALQRYRRQMKFYCPQCLEQVQLKIGNYNIPHFAHFTKINVHSCSQKVNLKYIYKVKCNYMSGSKSMDIR